MIRKYNSVDEALSEPIAEGLRALDSYDVFVHHYIVKVCEDKVHNVDSSFKITLMITCQVHEVL